MDKSENQTLEELELAQENAVADSSEPTEAPVKRPRGRPKGVKIGPRPRTWSCVGMVDDEIVHVRMSAPDSATPEQRGSFSELQAKIMFEDAYGVKPVSVLGPFHDYKGDNQASGTSKKRDTVSIALPKLTSDRKPAVFKGWRGIAYGIEGRDDVVYFMFGEEIQPSADKKRAVPQAKPVLCSSLEFENV